VSWEIFAAAGMACAGAAVVAVAGVKVLVAVRRLGRELDRARRQITPKQDVLRQDIRAFGKHE
jgi:hypothetical protein